MSNKWYLFMFYMIFYAASYGQTSIYKVGVGIGYHVFGQHLSVKSIGLELAKDIGLGLDIKASVSHYSGGIRASDIYNKSQLDHFRMYENDFSTIRQTDNVGIHLGKALKVSNNGHILFSLGGQYIFYKDATFGGEYLNAENEFQNYNIYTTTHYFGAIVSSGFSQYLGNQTFLNLSASYQTKVDLIGIQLGIHRSFTFKKQK